MDVVVLILIGWTLIAILAAILLGWHNDRRLRRYDFEDHDRPRLPDRDQ